MSPLKRLQPLLLTLASAILLPLSLPNPLFDLGSPLLGIAALVPVYIALSSLRSLRSVVWLGVLFGAVSTILGNFWLAFFQDFSIWTLGGAVVGYAIYNALLFPFLFRSLQARLPYRPLWFAALWTGYELLKSIGFLGYPWGLIAYSWNEVLPFIQIADLFGVYGISFLLVLTNAVIAEFCTTGSAAAPARAIVGPDRVCTEPPRAIAGLLQITAVLAALTAAAWTYGFAAMQRDIPEIGSLDLILIQNNGDPWLPGSFWQELEHTQRLTTQALAAGPPPDLVVWSETILRYPLEESRRQYQINPRNHPFLDFLGELQQPLLTGGSYMVDAEQRDMINAALLLDPDGTIREVYGKRQLVPFAETIPFFEYAPVRRFFAEAIGLRSMWLSGMEYRLFPIETSDGISLRYGTPICFEDAFAGITRDMVREGADFFINLTNNSWSRTNSAQTQHFAAARFRSIETRRTLVRSTNSGLTSVVDSWGRVTASLPMFTPAALRTTVPVHRPRHEPLYMVIGDAFAWLCLAAGLFGLAWQQLTGRNQADR